jgi:hypothetical protein
MAEQVNVDFMANGQAEGEVAAVLSTNGRLDPGSMRPYIGKDGKTYITVYKGGNPKETSSYHTQLVNTSGTLRRDEWKFLDDAVMGIAETRLNGIADLISRGLTYNLGNAMGTTVLESHDVGDALKAELSMDAVTRTQGDRPKYTTRYLPIPIVHVDYEINARVLAASRNLGNPIDTTLAERAARKVSEKLENMLFTDQDYSFGGGTIYSYLNYPNRNKVNLTKAWDDSTKTGAEILADVINLKQTSINNLHYGPWVIYIPTAYETVLDKDYDTSGQSTQTIRDRILKIGGVSDIKVVDTLTANNILFVQMTSDVVRLVRGMGLQNVQWGTEGNFITKYKVLTIQVPQIRSDQNGKCGLTHMASGLV